MLVRVVTVTFVEVHPDDIDQRTVEEVASRAIEKALRERSPLDATITDARVVAAKDVAA
jgi:hypothetical protein